MTVLNNRACQPMLLASDADHNLIEAPDIVPAWQLAARADVVKI
jgi:hypothetical protein